MGSKKDQLFTDQSLGKAGTFAFDQRVVEVFDDMVSRSVPGYATIQLLLADLALLHAKEETIVDLGCSTGETIFAIDKRAKNLGKKTPRCVGFDTSKEMILEAQKKLVHIPEASVLVQDIANKHELALLRPQVVIASLVLQFIEPVKRPSIVKNIYEALPERGAFLLVEKTIQPEQHTNKIFIDYYHSFKKEMGYSDMEIARKREALENVLIPFTQQQNCALLREAGFQIVTPFFQWFNFCAFLAIK